MLINSMPLPLTVLGFSGDLGVAMQFTNIARDVGEDALADRAYLPRLWLAEARVEADDWCAARHVNPGIAQMLQRLLRAADAWYRRALHGVADLPSHCRPAGLCRDWRATGARRL